jgi:RNA polymerase sigma-70 factor (ECF subfamily)
MTTDTETLLQRAAEGDQSAVGRLLHRHRERLRTMINLRMDPRIVARCDPSDVVQEALLDAHRQLPGYLKQRRVPFYSWLRHLAWQKLVDYHRRHLMCGARSVLREEEVWRLLTDHSTQQLARHFVSSVPNPSEHAAQSESCHQVAFALRQLSDEDREVLTLRILERLPAKETGAVLGISANAVRTRQFRALSRLEKLLQP